MLEFSTPIKYIKGIGEKRAVMLNRLGIFTVEDLLYHFPRVYQDHSKLCAIYECAENVEVSIKAAVCKPVTEHRIRKGMTLYKTRITDGESFVNITFFNNRFIKDMLQQGEEYIFTGKITRSAYSLEMNSPVFEKAETGERIRPVYPLTAGINSKLLEKYVKTALENTQITDPLPETLRNTYCLMGLKDSLTNVHAPRDEDYLLEARRRLIFEELLCLQLGLMRLKSKHEKTTPCVYEKNYTAEFLRLLPFEATGAQIRAINEAAEDMCSSTPMNRLLQGDVGSGKTAVAAALMFNSAKNGYQSALMAPTEVLAQQHFKTLSRFFENTGIKIALLTGSTPAGEKKKIKASLKEGSTDVVVGTHALIQKDVEFFRLGFVVTDEQHRFGVNQRTALGSKGEGESPHTLVMSATPIPRTLALIIYSDLNLSILDELPRGRQKTETYCVGGDKRQRAYAYVKKHLCQGRQGYIVCPLVEEDDESELTSAKKLRDSLADGFFKGFSVGLLHGKMKADEKAKTMEAFASGEIQLLISTTVIEVGIDVPNAVIMVVENAERFGLSQLHQLRGRIGRGEYKSTCILISDSDSPETLRRLKIMQTTTDGFKIADEDLKLRGPGDFFGSRQHGLPKMRIADMMSDTRVMQEARLAAAKLMDENPTLAGEDFTQLKKRINNMFLNAGSA